MHGGLTRIVGWRLPGLVLACGWSWGALALPAGAPLALAGGAGVCRAAIAMAEAGRRVPDGFLAAIARVESGRADPATGVLAAWPWTVNAEGVGSFYASKAEAVAAVQAMQARGVRSIDVGCMQVNLMHHPDAFGSLEQALDPAANAAYAAGFLVALFGQMGSWPLAAAAYHSQTPTLGSAYQKRVLAEWAVPADQAAGRGRRRAAEADDGSAPAAMRPAMAAAPMGAVGHVGTMVAQVGQVHVFGGTGRGLAAYRLMPTRLALRPPFRRG